MRLIYCSDYWNPLLPDPAYGAEVAAAKAASLAFSLLDFAALTELQNARQAARRIEPATDGKELALYRGWMLRPETYRLLYKALAEKDILLINSPAAYKHCHHLPEWYPSLAKLTPLTTWVPGGAELTMDEIMGLCGLLATGR